MEEPEVPLEQVQEHLAEHAHAERDTFVSSVALSTAIIAAFAAVASLLAGDHANEAMVSQIQSSDQWAFFQAKSIKATILKSENDILLVHKQNPDPNIQEKLAEYAREQQEIKAEAEAKHREAELHLRRHKLLAAGVTFLQIAIAVGAISALTKRRAFWGVSLAFGLAGVGFLLRELLFVVRPG